MSADAERRVLEYMKQMAGVNYTQKLEGMLKDLYQAKVKQDVSLRYL